MNNSSILPNLNSTSSLSSHVEDISNVFLIPAFSIGLIPLKLASLAVLIIIIKRKKEKKHKASQFYYLLTNETIVLMEVVIFCFTPALRCGSYCSFGYDYIVKTLDLRVYTYGIQVLVQTQIFLEIVFSLDRIKALKVTNTQVIKGMKFRYKLTISVAVSLIAAVPNYLMSRTITPIGILIPANQTLYEISSRTIFQTYFWIIALSVFDVLRGLAPMFALFIINIVLIRKFNSVSNQHSNVSSPENLEENAAEVHMKMQEMKISMLVLAINANYLIGCFPIFITPTLFLYLGSVSPIYIYYHAATKFLLIFCHYSYIFIFYKLSPSFKKTFSKTFINI